MRLDKYLKVSRLIKRRTLAKEVSDQGRIAKAGSDVKVEDVLTIRFGQKLVTVKVTALNEHASKDNAKGMYEIIEERRLEEA